METGLGGIGVFHADLHALKPEASADSKASSSFSSSSSSLPFPRRGSAPLIQKRPKGVIRRPVPVPVPVPGDTPAKRGTGV